jgi:hypothetical protein
MSVSVPGITDPRHRHLATLPFVHARASHQCHDAVRRIFHDAAEAHSQNTVQQNVQVGRVCRFFPRLSGG